jgi:hypothetical protein
MLLLGGRSCVCHRVSQAALPKLAAINHQLSIANVEVPNDGGKELQSYLAPNIFL